MSNPRTFATSIAPIHIKRGDTLSLMFLAMDDQGVAVDLTGSELQSNLRKVSGALLDVLTVEKSAERGVFVVSAHYTQTEKWSVGEAEFDVQETRDGVRLSSPTIPVFIVKDITREQP